MDADQQALRAVRDELVAFGAQDGVDFAVLGTGEPAGFSSELIVLHAHEGAWQVDYREMGRSRALLRTGDLAEARARFVDEVLELAGGRGRGPRRDPSRPQAVPLSELRRQKGWT